MARINIGELTLNVESAARARPSFSFPAWSATREFQTAEFSRRYRCIAFDHHGADKPKDAYATELIARDVIGLMGTLGIDKAHVAGTSTGECVLQNLAIDSPPQSGPATSVVTLLLITWTSLERVSLAAV